jgi:hypothetical protein
VRAQSAVKKVLKSIISSHQPLLFFFISIQFQTLFTQPPSHCKINIKMSGPYDSYGGQQPYGSQYPAQGYNQQSQYPSQGYNQQPQYGQPQQYPTYDQHSNFGPPRRADSFGPPVTGGFIDGQQGVAYGQYDASNPQGHAGYYGQQQPQQYGSNDAYAQNQAYQSGMSQQSAHTYGQPDAANHEFSRQSTDPNAPNYDPNAPPMTETDRGLLGAVGGGLAGHFAGKKAGNHGLLGTIGGAILGSMTEDYAKKQKKKHHHHSSQSSWGGSGRY